MKDKTFLRQMLLIALPISIQSLFQASLSVIDQFMVGQLGEASISAIAFGGKFMGILTFTIFAISSTASIMMAQFIGNKEKKGVNKAFSFNLYLGLIVAAIFFVLSFFFTKPIISIYTSDDTVIPLGVSYLKIISFNVFPILGGALLNAYLQNNNRSYLTMIAGLFSVICNTLLNWLFIFGFKAIPAMGVSGAALATLITQYLAFTMLLIFTFFTVHKSEYKINPLKCEIDKAFVKKNMIIAAPLIITEFMWSLGESIYATIYGHMSTNAMAAMANISPVISLSIGFFSGIAAASGILTGQKLGEKDKDGAYLYAKRFIIIELVGSVIMGLLLIALAVPYSKIYKVSQESKDMTVSIMIVYSIVLWAKVSNMVAGRIIQSGGKTIFNLVINLCGTWVVGIPLGFLAANVFNLSIGWVYFVISIEEIVRCILCFILIKSKKWIKFIATEGELTPQEA